MKELLEAILSGILTARRALEEHRDEENHTWKIYLSAIAGVLVAHTIVVLVGMESFEAWPYLTGLVVGVIYGVHWYTQTAD